MFRDEVLAIAEGTVDAYRKGVEEGKRDVGPYIIGLERAIKEMAPILRELACRNTMSTIHPNEGEEYPDRELRLVLNKLTNDAKRAMDASGVKHLRRDVWWDGVPF